MQKKIIALAVAGLVSGAAFAQTNVTVYGRADLGYAYSKSDFKKFSGIENGNGIGGGSSRLGFQGTENLGNGLKAIFKFEWGLAADEGGGATVARYTWVGLAGNFGQVTLGRNAMESDLYLGATGVQGINGREAVRDLRDSIGTTTFHLLDGDRWNNSIAYVSPNFSGFEFSAIYAFGEQTKVNKTDNYDTSDANRYGLGVKYANGPLYLTAVYEALADNDGAATPQARTGAKGWALGGTYDFKVVKLYANYYRLKANHNDYVVNGSDKGALWSVGVGIPVSSAGTVTVEYAQAKDYWKDGGRIGYAGAKKAGDKAKGITLGYKHVLSKRTSLYAYATRIDNDRGIAGGWSKTDVAGEDQTTFFTGILHTF
jgi:predicted porin